MIIIMELLTHLNMETDEKIFPRVVQGQFDSLGTGIDVQIIVGSEGEKKIAEKNIQEIKSLYTKFGSIFSRFDSNSELSKLNSSIGEFSTASPYMREVAAIVLKFNKETNTLFDPRVLSVLEKNGYSDDFKRGERKFGRNVDEKFLFFDRNLTEDLKVDGDKIFFGVKMDFSGIAKGYITDKIVELLVGQQWENFLVDSGGDMFMRGVDERNKKWTVSVEGINERKLMLALSGKAVATSGIGRRRWEIEGKRMHHIVNPKNPQQFLFDLKSVSVIADSVVEADVWAKTLFLMGKKDGMIYAREHYVGAIFLDYRGTVWISPKAKEFLC